MDAIRPQRSRNGRRDAGPSSQVNTNLASSLAVRWLALFGVNPEKLAQESRREVTLWNIGAKTVPLCRIEWHRELPC